MVSIMCLFRILPNISELFRKNKYIPLTASHNIHPVLVFFIIVASVYRPPTPLSSQQHHQSNHQQPFVMMAATGAPHANHNLQNIQMATNNQMMHGNWFIRRIWVALRDDLLVDFMTLSLCFLNLLIPMMKRSLDLCVVCIDIKRIRYIVKFSEHLHACPHSNF